MARFAPLHTSAPDDAWQDEQYQHGYSFGTEDYALITSPGISERVVELISHHKEEPDWMRAKRLEGFKIFEQRPMPQWGADLSGINFDSIHYYLRPLAKNTSTWADVPADIQKTFERIGVPQAEREYLAGVKMQYDSEVVYGSLKKEWEKDGVIFLSMDEGLAQHPDLVKQYFGTVIPTGDNKFAALNAASWSGGSFVYIPPGVNVKMPLQTYFRINSENAGQFERTLIIVDEGANVHYVEGCFTAGTSISTDAGAKRIEDITTQDKVLTHTGKYQEVYHTQVRPYTGNLFTVQLVGSPSTPIQATEEHPFLIVRRQQKNERNSKWKPEWMPIKDVRKLDYTCIPIDREVLSQNSVLYPVAVWKGKKQGFISEQVKIPSTEEFFRLAGYFLAEGSISSRHYLNFSFGSHERDYIEDVKYLLQQVFGIEKINEVHHKTNNGISLVVCSTLLCRIFEQFGNGCDQKTIPTWMMKENAEKQAQLLVGWFRGDGNYYNKLHKHGRKETFRVNTTSKVLAEQGRMLLARQNVASSLNAQERKTQGRKTMYVCVVGGQYLENLGKILRIPIDEKLNGKKRATFFHLDEKYLYVPVRTITQKRVSDISVYNFSVRQDESYTAEGAAVHNCTAPAFSSNSLHSAVVEIIVKKGARCQYTTIQNWYKTVYNLVTKRARVEEEGEMIWTDFNLGSKVTMKYPGFLLVGKGARGETLSMAVAGAGQHQDTGSKAFHLAPHTSSTIVSKSISKGGGRAGYRGMVHVAANAHGSKNKVVCDALILDPISRSDTYPTERVMTSDVQLEHEATVSKIGEEQLFYLMSRGLTEEEASKMIVRGFAEPLIKKLPLEYAVEMNRLIDLEMEGSIG